MKPTIPAARRRWRPNTRLSREVAGTLLLVASSSVVSPQTNAVFWGSSAFWVDVLGSAGALGMVLGLAVTFSACMRELKAIRWPRDTPDGEPARQ